MSKPRFVHEIPQVEIRMGRPGEWWVCVEKETIGNVPLKRDEATAIQKWLQSGWSDLMTAAGV